MNDRPTGTTHLSRRSALVGGSAGLAMLALANARRASGQDATPVTDPGATPAAADGSLLFVQSFSAASLVPDERDPSLLTVTLERDAGRTLYFSDRPARVVGIVETATFVQEFGTETATDPANAAIVSRDERGAEVIVVVELLRLSYDASSNTATYAARTLDDPSQLGLGFSGEPTPTVAGERRYGPTQLFIDAGGLMQIIAYGAQDVYLDGVPPAGQ